MLNSEANSSISNLPACQACGRQDETLRLAAYPYIFSIIFISFQRRFSGLWCRRHRIQYWLQAGLITSIFGWLGIPFGVIFTPVRLFQLMKGGVQPAEANAGLLIALGKKRLEAGNSTAAINCFEASLQYSDSPEVREQLRRLYLMTAKEEPIGWAKRSILWLGVVIVFGVLGFLAGLVDYALSYFLGGSIGGGANLIVSILLWTPFVTMIFLSISLLRCVVEWTVRYTLRAKFLYPLSMGVIALLMFMNGLATGESIGDFVAYSISGKGPASQAELIFTLIALLLIGGFEYLSYTITLGHLWAIIFDVLFLVSTIVGIVILWKRTAELSKWQTILTELRGLD